MKDVTGTKTKKYLDLNFMYKIIEDELSKSFLECFNYGICTAGNPKRNLDLMYSPRKMRGKLC